jgi:hypothetical protein
VCLFLPHSVTMTNAHAKQRHENVQYLDEAMSALLVTWTVTADSSAADGPAAGSREHTFSRTRLRARKVFEKVFKAQSSAVMGTLVRIWASNFKEIDVSHAALLIGSTRKV